MNRRAIACFVVGVIVVGAASRLWRVGSSLWDKSAGDVAYAMMIAFMLWFVRPRAKPIAIGAIAIGICFAIETFQLTGIPARAPRLLRIALGDTFAWHDMACYVVGGVLAAVLVHVTRRGKQAGERAERSE